MSKRRTIDVQAGDEQWIRTFEQDVGNLCGLVEEAFHENKLLLLSPVCREMIRERGTMLKAKLDKVRHKLCADNLGDPLEDAKQD